MIDFLNTIITIVTIIPWIISICSLIAALTPTPADDKLIGKLYRVIDWFAINVGKAKEK